MAFLKRSHKVKALALALALIFSISFFAYSYFMPHYSATPSIRGYVEVYKNGKLMYTGQDLLTNYFYQWFACILNGGYGQQTGYQTSATQYYFPSSAWSTDIGNIVYGGSTFTPTTSGNNVQCMTDTGQPGSANSRVWVGIGSGTATPTRTDKALSAKIGYASGSVAVSATATQANVTVAGSITVSSAVTVTETSLALVTCILVVPTGTNPYYIDCNYNANSGSSTLYTYTAIMLDHTSLSSPITTSAGDVVTVRYVFVFNTGNPVIAWMVANLFSGTNDFSGGVLANNGYYYGEAVGTNATNTATTGGFSNYMLLIELVNPSIAASQTGCSAVGNAVSVQLNLQSQQVNVFGPMNAACSGITTVQYTAEFTGRLSSGPSDYIAQVLPAATPIVQGQAVGIQFTGP